MSSLDDKKVAVQFTTVDDRIRGTGALFLLSAEDGYVGNQGAGLFIVSEHLEEYLREKGINFTRVPLPPKLRT